MRTTHVKRHKRKNPLKTGKHWVSEHERSIVGKEAVIILGSATSSQRSTLSSKNHVDTLIDQHKIKRELILSHWEYLKEQKNPRTGKPYTHETRVKYLTAFIQGATWSEVGEKTVENWIESNNRNGRRMIYSN